MNNKMSEKNTVTISTERYDELKGMERLVQSPRSKSIIIERNYGYTYRVETDDEVVAKLAEDLKEEKVKSDGLNNIIDEFEKQQYNNSVVDFKDMSIWSFIKWKNNN